MALTVNLLPKQWEVFRPAEAVDYDIALYQGGVGSGKTFLGVLTGLSILHENPGATWLVGADTFARLAISTCDTYETILQDAGIKYKYNRSEHILRIPDWDGAKVIFRGLDDPQSLRSVNGIGGHIEEASLLKEASYLEFIGRLRQAKQGQPIRLVLTTNPQTVRGWLYDHFVNKAGITEQEARGKILKVNRRRVIAKTIDNTHVSDAFIAAMSASYDPDLYRIMVLGEDGDYTKGLVNKGWSIANIDDVEYNPSLPIYLSCDFNIDPMSWVCAHRINGEYQFFDELVIEHTDTISTAQEFCRRYPGHTAGVIVTGDASGKNGSTLVPRDEHNYTQILNVLKERGFTQCYLDLKDGNPLVRNRTDAWNGKVCNNYGVRKVKVNRRCKWLIWNCENLRFKEGTSEIWEPTKVQIEQDAKLKFTKHVWDAASYLVDRYDPITPHAPSKIVEAPRPYMWDD